MSSRQEEKERRRREREEAERQAAQAASRRKRIGIVGIGALAAAVIVIVVLAVASGGDDGNGGAASAEGPVADAPTQGLDKNLAEAAKAAGCTVEKQESEGSEHTTEAVKYEANPPTSGDHDPVPSEEGEYEPGNPPDLEQSVHALEHGRILVQYKPGAPENRVAQLRSVALTESVKGSEGYKTLFFQNQTEMEPALAATAWTQSLTCPDWNDQVFDAVRAFRRQFVDKGPEFIP